MRHLLTKTLTVKRMSADAGNAYTSTYQTIGTVVAHIEPASAGDAVIVDGAVGQIFIIYLMHGANVRVADQLIDGNNVYVVEGLEIFDLLGRNKHIEATARKMSE